MKWKEFIDEGRWSSSGVNWRDRYTINLKNGEYVLSRFMYRWSNTIEKVRDMKIQHILDETNLEDKSQYIDKLEAFFIGGDQWKFQSLDVAKYAAECDFNSYPDITLNPLTERISTPDEYLWG